MPEATSHASATHCKLPDIHACQCKCISSADDGGQQLCECQSQQASTEQQLPTQDVSVGQEAADMQLPVSKCKLTCAASVHEAGHEAVHSNVGVG